MSAFNDIDITCEQCGHEFRGTIWTAVHAKLDPELKELLLGGELNIVMCPECAHTSYQDHFVLYQDPAAELIAYVYPEVQKSEMDVLRTVMIQGFRETQNAVPVKDRFPYDPILMFGLESLVDMMREEEHRAEQSQIAQEICKENEIPIHLLSPTQARRRSVMRVIPYAAGSEPGARASILKGCEQLLALNPKLDLYERLKNEIEADSHWQLPVL